MPGWRHRGTSRLSAPTRPARQRIGATKRSFAIGVGAPGRFSGKSLAPPCALMTSATSPPSGLPRMATRATRVSALRSSRRMAGGVYLGSMAPACSPSCLRRGRAPRIGRRHSMAPGLKRCTQPSTVAQSQRQRILRGTVVHRSVPKPCGFTATGTGTRTTFTRVTCRCVVTGSSGLLNRSQGRPLGLLADRWSPCRQIGPTPA